MVINQGDFVHIKTPFWNVKGRVVKAENAGTDETPDWFITLYGGAAWVQQPGDVVEILTPSNHQEFAEEWLEKMETYYAEETFNRASQIVAFKQLEPHRLEAWWCGDKNDDEIEAIYLVALDQVIAEHFKMITDIVVAKSVSTPA